MYLVGFSEEIEKNEGEVMGVVVWITQLIGNSI